MRHPFNSPLKGKVAFCVQGVISPLLSNIYLHHVLDTWFEQEAKPRLRGRCQLVRYADDFVLLFENRRDGERLLAVLGKRLERYGLTLHADKTRFVDFPGEAAFWSRCRRTRSTFRDSPICGCGPGEATSCCGKPRPKTASRGRCVRCGTGADGIATLRCPPSAGILPASSGATAPTMAGPGTVLGCPASRFQVIQTWRKWLSRRSRSARINWDQMATLLRQYSLPTAKAVHSKLVA